MAFNDSFIPYGAYWSSPFCRWQGKLSSSHSLELAASTAKRFLGIRELPCEALDGLVVGTTVPQRRSFYGAPWMAGMIGVPGLTGPTVAQACATSARGLLTAAADIEVGARNSVLVVMADRTSNGPHVYYPNPRGVGGRGETEEWVWDNFNRDPWTGHPMLTTAENVAREAGISKEEQDATTLIRHAQYADGLANNRDFQKRYMCPVVLPKGRKKVELVEEDDGVYPTTEEGLAKLRPAIEGGSVSFGTQTFPADGNAGMVVCSRERAADLSTKPDVTIQLLGFGDARVKKAHMPMAVVPAARGALHQAGIDFSDCAAIKTHNPFAVNDIYFSRETGIAIEDFNRYGSPLIYGHPQGPTGLRAVAELIEELVLAGGGYGLFSGCAAGDTAMALVLKVS